MIDVGGRTAFITGGANGIGLGIARAFAQAGAKLALADLDVAALARAKAELESVVPVETYRLDVRDRDAFAAAADSAEDALGPVSLLFNNAGVIVAEAPGNLTYALWDFSVGINLGGVINGVQTFLPRMIRRKLGGHVVNTASTAGLAPVGSGVLYSTAKYGVVGLAESLRPDVAAHGIGVSVLCPGPVATNIVHRSMEDAPPGAVELTEAHEQRRADRREAISQALQQGSSADDVGRMVLDAVHENRFFIHTDRSVEEPFNVRTRALLDALPG